MLREDTEIHAAGTNRGSQRIALTNQRFVVHAFHPLIRRRVNPGSLAQA